MDTYTTELPDVLKSQCGFNCLTDICHYSFDEFRQQVSGHLSWSETQHLYRSAQQAQKENRLYEARLLKRTNPSYKMPYTLPSLCPTQSYVAIMMNSAIGLPDMWLRARFPPCFLRRLI
ncbi:hypothetical protein ABLB69_00160 [Xenorhabdus khoisanae]|uniref:hypothetical protein n=1 Tax=Xenorhabdus khoisanae TaxID=880157 RepID=UPI0032B71373